MVDVKRRLTVPSRFVPYMETHRLYELFYELATELTKNQPADHILYMKQAISKIIKSRDKPRIIILAPPHIDKLKLGQLIAEANGVVCVTSEDIRNAFFCEQGDESKSLTIEVFAKIASKYLRSNDVLQRGWIIVDFPTTGDEAVILQKAGIMPTHTLQLLPSTVKVPRLSIDPIVTCTKALTSSVDQDTTIGLSIYRRNLLGLRDKYQATLREVEVRERTLDQLATDCWKLATMPKHYGAPMLPRVVIIGQRGSGRKTQARKLCHRFSLIHVDLKKLLAKTRLEGNEIAKKLQLIDVSGIDIYPDFLVKIIEKRILNWDCLSHGWVITGYPRNVDDFKFLNETDTPPNRVIFLNVPAAECVNRIAGRRYNPHTGSKHQIDYPPPEKQLKHLRTHPNDHPVCSELKQSHKNIQGLKEYAKRDVIQVDGTKDIRTVYELISGAIIRPPPTIIPGSISANSVTEADSKVINHQLSER